MRSFKSILYSTPSLAVLAQMLRIGTGMLTLPLALHIIPQKELGLYYTFLGLAMIVALLDFGFGPTISRFASYAQAGAKEFKNFGTPEVGTEPNLRLIAELFHSSRVFYHWLAVVTFVWLALAGTWFLSGILEVSALPRTMLGCWGVMAFTSCLALGTSYYAYLLQGIGRIRESVILQIQAQLLTFTLTVTLLLLGAGIWSYAWAGLVTGIFQRVRGGFLFARYATIPRVNSLDAKSRRVIFTALWPSAWRMGLVCIGAYLINRFNTLICADSIGLQEAATYGLTLQLMGIISAGAMAPLNIIWPRVTMLRASRNNEGMIALFAPRLYGCLALFGISVISLAFMGNPLLDMLGAKTHLMPSSLTLLLGLIAGLEMHHTAYATLVITENRNPFVLLSLGGGIGVVLLSSGLVKHIGVLGLLLGQGSVQLVAANWIPVVSGIRGLDMGFTDYLLTAWRAIACQVRLLVPYRSRSPIINSIIHRR